MSMMKTPHQPISNLKTQDSPKKTDKQVRLKEIVEVMHEDAEHPLLEQLTDEPKIKGPRKSKRKRTYDAHKGTP